VKNRRDLGIKKRMIKIDNSILVVELYNTDLCVSVANFITINLLTDCTMDVRA